MKYLRKILCKIKNSKTIAKLRSVKNPEMVLAAILALVAIVCYFAISAGGKATVHKTTSTVEAKMTSEEQRLSFILSKISGIDEANVYISYGDDKEISGVVVVVKGADSADKRVSVIRCVETATGASVDKIRIFQMANGG